MTTMLKQLASKIEKAVEANHPRMENPCPRNQPRHHDSTETRACPSPSPCVNALEKNKG